MKNKLLKLISIITIFILAFSVVTITAAAAETIPASISFTKGGKSVTNINPGDDFVVNITITGTRLLSIDFNLKYDTNSVKYISGATSGGNGIASVNMDTNFTIGKNVTYSLSFRALTKTGNPAFSLSGEAADEVSPQVVKGPTFTASKSIKIEDKQLSSNANMKSLSVRCLDKNNKEISCKMTPSFSKNTTEYTVNVPNSVVKCLLNGEREEGNPSDWNVEGSSTMKVGKNIRKVVVTAPSGAQKIYTITINRGEEVADTPDEPDTDLPDTPTENPLETKIDNATYIIATDISAVKLFKGFEIATTEYKGQEIPVARDKDGNYEIYYLYPSDSDVLVPYTYNKNTDTFKKLAFFTQNDVTYIFEDLPLKYANHTDYFTTNTEINGNQVKCYQSNNSKLSDFYYFYCFNGEDYNTYRYDSREGVLQRFPEMILGISSVSAEDFEKSDDTPEIIKKFKTLDHNAKIFVISFLVAIIIAIALVILLLIKLFTKNKYKEVLAEDDFPTENFDEVTINDEFVLTSDTVEDNDDNF